MEKLTLEKTEDNKTTDSTNKTLSAKKEEKLAPSKTDEKQSQEEKKHGKVIKKKKKKGLMARLSAIGTISQREVVEFTRHLAVMLGAGVTIFEAIQFLTDQTKNKAFKDRLEGILDKLNNGQSLSGAMHKYPKVFLPIYVNIVHVGEQSGTLPETMTNLANHLEENEKFRSKVKGALIYPKIIIGVMITFMLILLLFVMPRILTIFKSLGAEIPLATRIMISTTNFVNDNIFMIFVAIFAFGILIYFIFKHPIAKKARDRFYIKVPLVGNIVLNYNTAQVSQHFGTLFASGLTILKCLEITKTVVANNVFQEEIAHMINKIKNGSSLSQSFKEQSEFPTMFTKLIKVGERTGKLPHVVDYMANYYQGIVDNDVKNITSIIEPAIMVLLGLMVTGLVVTVIGPIYTLISNVGA